MPCMFKNRELIGKNSIKRFRILYNPYENMGDSK